MVIGKPVLDLACSVAIRYTRLSVAWCLVSVVFILRSLLHSCVDNRTVNRVVDVSVNKTEGGVLALDDVGDDGLK